MSVSSTSTMKIIKPLNPNEFNETCVNYSSVKVNKEMGNSWVDTTYSRVPGREDKFLVVARGCVIKTFKKMDPPKDSKDITKIKDKYQIFMTLKDKPFIEMVKRYEEALCVAAPKLLFGSNEFDENDCREMLKTIVPEHEKYGYSIGGIIGREFTCKSKTNSVPDVSDLNVALAKNNIIDVCFWFNKVKIGAGKFNIGLEINQINVTNIGDGGVYVPNGLKIDEFQTGKFSLAAIQQHDKGGKYCKVFYDGKPFRVLLENINCRIFKFEKDGQKSYSLMVPLANEALKSMFENVDNEIFKIILDNSKDYYGVKKNAKILKNVVKSLTSYNKNDLEKIAKGEKPTYNPSIWIKIYYSEEEKNGVVKGFDGKIINSTNKKPIENVEELLNKDLNISSLEFYSRHVWFGPKGTSTNLTLNRCSINYETTVYDMDDVDREDDEENEEDMDAQQNTENNTDEVVNSDNE
jgi:hypothetical protein